MEQTTINTRTLEYLKKCFLLTLSFFLENPTDFLQEDLSPDESELEIVKQLEEFESIGKDIDLDIWTELQGSKGYSKYRELYLKHQ